MVELRTADISIVSLIILIIIYINVYWRYEKALTPNRLFLWLIRLNILMIVVDLLGWAFNGQPGELNRILNIGTNLLLYISAPVVLLIWALYADYQVFQDESRLRRKKRMMLGIFLLNVAVCTVNLFTGWFFSVDSSNIYHRGELFWLHVSVCYVLMTYSFILVLVNKKKFERRYYYVLLAFFLPPSAGILIQALNYGVSYNWIGMMVSILIIYLYIQDRGLGTDYLTGVYNRRQYDSFIKSKLRAGSQNAFACIMLDLDNFKAINDNFGHDAGDQALKYAVTILRKSLRQNDFIARIGGDEFIVVLDTETDEMLTHVVSRIKAQTHAFNNLDEKPYKISFSMGYAVYDFKTDHETYFNHIDKQMYQDKRRKYEAIQPAENQA